MSERKRSIKVDKSLMEKVEDGEISENDLDDIIEELTDEHPGYDKSATVREKVFGFLEVDEHGCVSRGLKEEPPAGSGVGKREWKKYRATLRRQDIVHLHTSGKSFGWIADYFEYADAAGARYHWNAALDELNEDTYADIERFRAKATLRYERWMNAIADRILQGDLGAMDRGIKMTESMARMFGANLERTEAVQTQVNVGGVVVVHGDEQEYVSGLMKSGMLDEDAAKAIQAELTEGQAPELTPEQIQEHMSRNAVEEEVVDAELVED